MRHQPLTLDALQALPDELIKVDKNNPQRQSFATLFKHLAVIKAAQFNPEEMTKILTGMLIFEMEYIRYYEYYGYSPNKGEDQSYLSWFLGTGSDVYTLIKNKLHSVKNPLNDDHRLIYLNAFYGFIKDHLREEEISQYVSPKKKFSWTKKKILMDQILHTLKYVKERESSRIAALTNAEPLPQALASNIKQMDQHYTALNNNRWWINQNSKHASLLKFVALIDRTAELEQTPERAQEIRLGSILYLLMSIRDEYSLLSPEGNRFLNKGSELYKQALHALNKKSLKNIDRETRLDWLTELKVHIKFMKKNHQDELAKLCEELDFHDLDRFLDELDHEITDQDTKKKAPSWTATGINYAVQSVVGFTAAQYTAEMALPALVGGINPLGLIVYLAGGTILISQVGKKAVDGLWSWILDKIGTKVSEQTSNMAAYTVTKTKEGLLKLFKHPSVTQNDKEDIIEWIITLLKLPTEPITVINAEDKEHIRNMLGITNGVEQSEEEQIRQILGVEKTKPSIIPFKLV